jgi:hypothetical protein
MKTTFKGVTIYSEYMGDRCARWNEQNYNRHDIKIKYNGRSAVFDFWASIMNPELQEEKELIEVLEIILRDAEAGEMRLEVFIDEYGYEVTGKNIKMIIDTHKECQRTHKKIYRVLGKDYIKIKDAIWEHMNA